MVRFLLEHCQADVNAQTFDGATPLRLAVGRRHSCIETVLLQAGADPASLNSDLLKYEESEDEVCNNNCILHSVSCIYIVYLGLYFGLS